MRNLLIPLHVLLGACSVLPGSASSDSHARPEVEPASGAKTAEPGSSGLGQVGPMPQSGSIVVRVPEAFALAQANTAAGNKVTPRCRWHWSVATRSHLGGGKYGKTAAPASTVQSKSEDRKMAFTLNNQRMKIEDVDCGESAKIGWAGLKEGLKSCKDCIAAQWGDFEWAVVTSASGAPLYKRRPFKVYQRITPETLGEAPAPPSAGLIESEARSSFDNLVAGSKINHTEFEGARITTIEIGETLSFEWTEDGNYAVYRAPAQVTVAYPGQSDAQGRQPWYYVACDLHLNLKRHRTGNRWRALGDCGEDGECSFPQSCTSK